MPPEFEWTCKNCGEVNCDDFTLTAFPCCEGCGEEDTWDELLTLEQIQQGNAIIIERAAQKFEEYV